MKFYTFRKWAKDVAPTFKSKEDSINKIKGNIKWVYFNPTKEVTTREGKTVSIPANINVALDNEIALSFSIEWGSIFRAVMNSLLSAEIWSPIEFYTYVNKDWYKTVALTNPTVTKEIEYNNKKINVNESYRWAYDKNAIPEIEVIKNKKWEFVSMDDADANEFFTSKIIEKFWKKDNDGGINLEDIPF